uniref:Uncharacterized protein n=1 Tax=Oryza punctata TaxID=4537 RepID=A0A0E0KRT9_ORYPU
MAAAPATAAMTNRRRQNDRTSSKPWLLASSLHQPRWKSFNDSIPILVVPGRTPARGIGARCIGLRAEDPRLIEVNMPGC